MQTIFRADLRKLQASDPYIPRHLLSHGLAAAHAQAASEEAAAVGGPKASTRPIAGDSKPAAGLVTTHGVRARHDELIRARGGLHFSIENSPAWHIVGVPTRRMADDGPGLALAL
jgi:hypothetical protein